MASCQSVTYVNGDLIGDPLEIKMIEDTNWQLDENTTGSNSGIGGSDMVLAYVRPMSEVEKPGNQSSGSQASGSVVKRPGLAIIKRFDFESSLQRMSVIVKNESTNQYRGFVKGSPEKIAELSIQSTLPKDYHKVLEVYTNKGYRVIALGTKVMTGFRFLQLESTQREQIEKDLHFLGFLIMENKLKSAT